jgi:hypothetical protein
MLLLRGHGRHLTNPFFYTKANTSFKFLALLEILDVEVVVPGHNPFGAVVYGELKVRARLKWGGVFNSTHWSFCPFGTGDDKEPERSKGAGTYYPGSFRPARCCETIRVPFLELGQRERQGKKEVLAVAVERTSSRRDDGLDEYRRIGLLQIGDATKEHSQDGIEDNLGAGKRVDDVEIALNWFEDASSETVILV